MGFAHEYATAIMHRGRIPMEPVGFVPDWSDRPRKGKFYPGAESFPLPEGDDAGPGSGPGPAATVQEGVFGNADPQERCFSLPLLGGMLLDSYGRTGRRLGVQTNTDLPSLPLYTDANWSRGTASGGGLYPATVYWVSGPGGPLAPGVHHYSTTHHAMQRLLTGDVSAEVREAAGLEQNPDVATDQFLVLGVKFWQNAFKYNSFCMHAVSMDVGALLQTWRMWARARGLRIEPALWFDEERIARLLGLDVLHEGVFAVVPLTWDRTAAAPSTGRATGPAARVRRTESERSRRVIPFETVRRIQAATLENAAARPEPGALAPAAVSPEPPSSVPGAAPVALPEPAPLSMGMREALRRRRSSFGRFDARRPLAADQLAATLAAAASASVGGDATGSEGPDRQAGPDGQAGPDMPRLTRLYVFVNHVEGIAPGAYAYEPGSAHGLRLVKPGPPGDFLQRNYFLSNYNLEQAAAVVVPAVRTAAVLDAVGDRGYRLVNATVGAVAQTFYTTATALGVGSGVALGFDTVSFVEELELAESGEAPLLIMLVGHERPGSADFRYEIA
ncbi:SagB family peptide dehydrogenase [Streptomyces telluris]|uniref:SagB family peptide dehydrogenase n=1 Tax=Streptomyces telluris TaxID=2720021 RepID=A0A9X2RLR2_9ACTN|nr:SagB family peptide dehydrogenase [Streptomyces telluris]MCQ8771118.1 SagB family peptide dehydrogenase [Streptomyces telluris]